MVFCSIVGRDDRRRAKTMSGRNPIYSGYNLPAELEVALQRSGEWSDAQLLREQKSASRRQARFTTIQAGVDWKASSRADTFGFSVTINKTTRRNLNISLSIALAEIDRVANYGDEFSREFALCVSDLIAKIYLPVFLSSICSVLAKSATQKHNGKSMAATGLGFVLALLPRLFAGDVMTLSLQANENAHAGRVVYGDDATIYRHRKVIERAAAITHQIATSNRSLLQREVRAR